MNTTISLIVGRLVIALGLVTLLFTIAERASAQNGGGFQISSFTVDGGGGASTGGVYSISGTIGQPDAGGPATGGAYSLVGGFWAWPALVQTAGAPTLYITKAAPGFVTLWWTPAAPGFVLQESPALSSPAWTYAASGANNPVTVPATLPVKFYRLIKP